MKRTGKRIADRPVHESRMARRLQVGGLLLAGALTLGGCIVVPAHPAYVAPARVYVAPVYVAPAPAYVYHGYGWRRGYGRW
jgi:hypothetical protein